MEKQGFKFHFDKVFVVSSSSPTVPPQSFAKA